MIVIGAPAEHTFEPRPRSGDQAQLLEAYGHLQSLLLTVSRVEDFLDELARLAADLVVPPAACGITVRRDGRPLTMASSDSRAAQLDEAQYVAGDGPCLQTLRTGVVNDIADLDAESRWPWFREQAQEHGVRSSLSLPLQVDGEYVGALNIYGAAVDTFADQRQAAHAFAGQAAAALTLLGRQTSLTEDAAQLEQALASRTTIDQALGILDGRATVHRRRGLRDAAGPLAELQPQAAGRGGGDRRARQRGRSRAAAALRATAPPGPGPATLTPTPRPSDRDGLPSPAGRRGRPRRVDVRRR